MNLPQDELHAWLALAGGNHLSRARARRLLAHFGGPVEVFQAGLREAENALGGEPCSGYFAALQPLAGVADRTRRWLAEGSERHVMTLADAHYPASLLESPDPPLVLHALGALACLQRPAVALVGSRHATPAGVLTAKRLSTELATLGIEVVSGLAVGIDAAAHEAALSVGGLGSTVAVVGCGLQEVYPRAHQGLFDQIAQMGLVLSEHPLGTPALPAYFPQRNRIIAGLSVAVVVVEAALRSGSLITARLATEAGRDVFAVPGHLSSPQSAGCNWLIKNGAGLLEHVRDIIEAQPGAFSADICAAVQPVKRRSSRTMRQESGQSNQSLILQPPGASSTAPHTAEDTELLAGFPLASWARARQLLRSRSCDLAELSTAASVGTSEMTRALLMAELEGLVARLPGGLYQWCGHLRR